MRIEVISIKSLAYGGDAVGFLADGRVCFVPGALPQEKVEVGIVSEKKRFVRGVLRKILTPSPRRIVPECPHFVRDNCPGCSYIHLDYPDEIFWKQQQLEDFLVRSELLPAEKIRPPFASPERFGMRNKLTLHRQNGITGYVGKDNKTVFQLEQCLLAQKQLNLLISRLPQSGNDPKITLRQTAKDGAVIVEKSNRMLTETLPGFGDFLVAPDGFFQTNIPVAAEMVRRAVEYIEASNRKKLLELYCGVGVFSICAAAQNPALECRGIEISKNAVAAAQLNAENHHCASRCRFAAGDAGKLLKKYGISNDAVLLLDPPRSGVEKECLQQIISSPAPEIIYISCAPDTLCRDLKLLKNSGRWEISESGLLDMFPGTAHFETVTLLKRK